MKLSLLEVGSVGGQNGGNELQTSLNGFLDEGSRGAWPRLE